MVFKGLFSRLSRDMGVDLGTANTLIYVRREGIVLREPSVVAKRTDDGQILAVGEEAKRMIGRTPGEIVATRPLRDGVIADFDTTASMLAYFIRKSLKGRTFMRPRVIVGIPAGVTSVEKRAVIDATEQAGAREAAPSGSAATRWTRGSSSTAAAPTTCSSASAPRKTSRSRSARPTR